MKKTEDTKQLESDINEFTEIIGKLKFALVRRNPKILNDLDIEITPMQFGLCMLLKINGKLTMGELSNAIGVSMPTLTGIIDRLVKREIVIRDKDEKDRRVVLVSLSPTGERVLEKMRQIETEHVRPIMTFLSSEDRGNFLRLWREILRGIIPNLENNEVIEEMKKFNQPT